MGCSSCKEKKKKMDIVNNTIEKTESKIKIFFIIWSLFGIYGFISFIMLFF